jgi:hypothetical protein
MRIFTISLSASKTFLVTHLFNNSGGGLVELLKGEQLKQIQVKFSKVSSPNICNLVVTFQHHSTCGYIDSILELKSKSRYDYIQKCCFLGQVVGQKVFIFKMLINGVGNGVNLVMRMQPTWDLHNIWIMFDHVKCVVGWTTMASHVYDLTYCKVMTIAICDM